MQSLDTSNPHEASFHLPDRADRSLRRVQSQTNPVTGSTFSATGIKECRFSIPSDTAFLDTASMYVSFVMNVTSDQIADKVALQAEGAGLAIQRILIKMNNTTLEDLQDHQKVYKMLYKVGVPENYTSSVGRIAMGMESDDLVAATASGRSYKICLPLNASAVFNSGSYLPLALASNLDISLFMNTAIGEVVALDTAATGTASYSISNVFLHYDLVYMPDEYNRKMVEYLAQGGQITMHLAQHKVHLDNLKGTTNNILNVSEYVESLKSVYFYMENASDISNAKKKNVMKYNGLKTFQVRNGSQSFPQQPIDVETNHSEAYFELLKSFGILHNVLGGTSGITEVNWGVTGTESPTFAAGVITPRTTEGSRFILGINLENHTGGLISGNLSELLSLDVRLTGASSDNVVCVTLYDKFVSIGANGVVEVSE